MKLSKLNNLIFCGLCAALLTGRLSAQTQTLLWPELHGQVLLDSVIKYYRPTRTLGYDKARDTMYKVIDLKTGNQLTCVYTGYTITLDLSKDPSTDAYNKNINCEHSWPQSMGADVEPQKSDLHHLFPVYEPVNSSRGNDPFQEISDEKTDRWYRLTESRTTKPTQYINEYSEKENDAPQCFEPREDHKGNVARAMCYFFAMYRSAADTNFWHYQKSTFLTWNYLDPVDLREYTRTMQIATYQGKPNPFVLDSTLIRRIWFYQPETGVAEAPLMAQHFTLLPPYPNPFNAVTHFQLRLPVAADVCLQIFNLQGRSIQTLVDGFLAPGNYDFQWDAHQLPSSVYLYRVRVNNDRLIGKVLLVK